MRQAPLGERVEGWTPPVHPGPEKIIGKYVELELLSAQKHAANLFKGMMTFGITCQAVLSHRLPSSTDGSVS